MIKFVPKLSPHNRNVWGYVDIAFNRVDTERLKTVGPDRMCAEWIIKNGGAVRFASKPKVIYKEYDMLSEGNSYSSKLKEIDATDACIMKIGFEHLKGCTAIDKIILNRCKHLEHDALSGLHYVKETLKELQVTSCYNFRDAGILSLKSLENLKELIIYDLPYVANLDQVKNELKEALPHCNIITTQEVSETLDNQEKI